MPQIENTIPVLPVRDLDASIHFYKEVMGFDVEWNAGTVCSVARDGWRIMLRAQPESPAMVWMGVDDSIIERLKDHPGVLQPPTNQTWALEMKLADPDGNVIWLGAEPR